MSSRHLPRVMGQRGKTTLELEREQFEKSQTMAINKAINTQETPVKEKHLRNTILGTFTDQGGGLFWHVTTKLQLQANPIICWKFCHVFHKLLREGHKNIFIDSQRYRTFLEELGKLWGHLKDGYGRLIAAYTMLLNQKLTFHRKYPEIPGNLVMSDEQFFKLCGSDVNNYFEISVDMLDYMDEVLTLQSQVYGSLDRSRSNSMTNSGQCRLAPLILCIQDSCQIYDYTVKSLFKLHSSLPPDTLSGHRDRFLSQYKKLKEFYYQSGNLQYFKNLVTVPILPDEPPNFLIQSDFSKHVKPVAVIPVEEAPERDSITPEPEPVVADLIDTTIEDKCDAAFGGQMGSFSFNGGPPAEDERDLLIERLTREIQQLKAELERVKTEDQRIITSLRDEISKLEKILAELRVSADKALQENENLKSELSNAKVHVGAVAKLTEAEKHSKANEEKFKKMKDVYQKLRDEHVNLLRQHADVTKQSEATKKSLAEKEEVIKVNEADKVRMEDERKAVQESLQKSANEVTQELALSMAKNTDLEKNKQELESQVKLLSENKESLEQELQTSKSDAESLQSQLQTTTQEKEEQHEQMTNQITSLGSQLNITKEEKKLLEEQLAKQIAELERQLEETQASKAETEQNLTQQIAELQEKFDKLTADKQLSEANLNGLLDELHRKLLSGSLAEGRAFIQDALDQFHNPTFTTVRCTAEFLLLRGGPVITSLEKLKSASDVYKMDRKDLETFVECITGFSHHLGDCVIHGIATSQSTAEIEPGQALANLCRTAGESGLSVLGAIEKGGDISSEVETTIAHIKELMSQTTELVPKTEDIKKEELGDMVDSEMQMTSKAIEQAAAKFQEMLQKTRKDNSGIQLEVNERILDACTDLMKAIRILIEKSRDLQHEIVNQGRGTSTVKDFYKKNHRWTEGFISAAKTVGWGAKTLMEAADRVINGQGKLEELIVCSQEIAASTAQLVVASRVKSKRESQTLLKVTDASKDVSRATGNVVASVKTGTQIIEEQSLMDFSHLSLIQTKKQEMDSQVRVLELERELEMERQKMLKLRRQHYQLAAEEEGTEQEEEDEEDENKGNNPWDYAPMM